MAAERASAALGVTATMATAARYSAVSGATAVMSTADGNDSQLAVARTAALGTAAARAAAVRGSEQGRKLMAVRAAVWEALICQRP